MRYSQTWVKLVFSMVVYVHFVAANVYTVRMWREFSGHLGYSYIHFAVSMCVITYGNLRVTEEIVLNKGMDIEDVFQNHRTARGLTKVLKWVTLYNVIFLRGRRFRCLVRAIRKADGMLGGIYILLFVGTLFFNFYIITRFENWRDLEVVISYQYFFMIVGLMEMIFIQKVIFFIWLIILSPIILIVLMICLPFARSSEGEDSYPENVDNSFESQRNQMIQDVPIRLNENGPGDPPGVIRNREMNIDQFLQRMANEIDSFEFSRDLSLDLPEPQLSRISSVDALKRMMENWSRDYQENDKLTCPTCCVCLEDFNIKETIIELHCDPKHGHLFHPDCIDSWSKKEKTCPLCRKDFVELIKNSIIQKKNKEEEKKSELSRRLQSADPIDCSEVSEESKEQYQRNQTNSFTINHDHEAVRMPRVYRNYNIQGMDDYQDSFLD
ncbi:unnamed protein product [Moneuplotes crassus]|uniref:RING-type domain-containing protein n=1 Tax=Euplotes crassus TaxID=5936 RepID=A0AAD1U592_EUPCR|nr:unnamed protein product [Moneuplotes crassus]